MDLKPMYIYSFNRGLWDAHLVPTTFLGTKNVAVNETDKTLSLMELMLSLGDIDSKKFKRKENENKRNRYQ